MLTDFEQDTEKKARVLLKLIDSIPMTVVSLVDYKKSLYEISCQVFRYIAVHDFHLDSQYSSCAELDALISNILRCLDTRIPEQVDAALNTLLSNSEPREDQDEKLAESNEVDASFLDESQRIKLEQFAAQFFVGSHHQVRKKRRD